MTHKLYISPSHEKNVLESTNDLMNIQKIGKKIDKILQRMHNCRVISKVFTFLGCPVMALYLSRFCCTKRYILCSLA